MALYFHFNETTRDLVYSDKATYDVEGYTSLGEQVNTAPSGVQDWVFNSHRSDIKTVTKDSAAAKKIDILTQMGNMFSDCSNAMSIDVSGFDTSKVTNMSHMFRTCSRITRFDLSELDTSNVQFMTGMFEQCSSLTSIDLSGFDTSNVEDMSQMFAYCARISSIDFSGFNTSKVTNKDNMFWSSSKSLRLITISDNMSNILDQLPADQYYPAAGGSPVAKADLTAGTWVRDEADLTKVTSLVQQAQMSQAISRRIGSLRRDLEDKIKLSGVATASLEDFRTYMGYSVII